MTKKFSPKKVSRTLITVVVLAALPLAVSILSHKASQSRQVASTEDGAREVSLQSADLSEASPQEFQRAFKYQVLKDAKLTDFSDGKRLHLGAFLMRDRSGQRASVCERFPLIVLTFSGEGVAFSGEIPTKHIKAVCHVATDQVHLEGILIELPSDVEGLQWNWTGIKFVGSSAGDTLEINGYEIISVLGAPLVF